MTRAPAADALLARFDGPWRDDTPVFGCCRRAVGVALEAVDVDEVAGLGATDRVQALRAAVDADMPGHLEAHRCCVGHLADLAFDLPDAVGEAVSA